MTKLHRSVSRVAAAGIVLFLASTGADARGPRAIEELLRLEWFTLPIRGQNESEMLAYLPDAVLVLNNQKTQRRFVAGSAYTGDLATVGSTSEGWLLGTTEGVWEIRLNDRDLRKLPEMGSDGVYRFAQTLAVTANQVFRLKKPWERYPYPSLEFSDLTDVWDLTDTLYVASRKGLRRLLWEKRTWDDAPLGTDVEKESLARFLLPSAQNEIDRPDDFHVDTPPLLVGARHVFYEEAGSRQWRPIEGVRFPDYRRADTDSIYRKIRHVMFHTLTPAVSGQAIWRRWLVAPTGVCRLELPGGGVPYQTALQPLGGDVRDTFVDSVFVWVGTTEDLYVIDREFETVDPFFEAASFVWGFLGRPTETTYNVQAEERGWYALTGSGMTEVFTKSWSWDAYGADEFTIDEVRCAAADVDGFWVGTTRGMRWFDTSRREWVPSRAPPELRSTPILKMEWRGNELYALTGKGIFSSTRYSWSWVLVAPASG